METETKLGTKELVDPRIFEPLYGKRGLIDADIIAYRCAFAAEKTYYKVGEDLYDAYKDIPRDIPKDIVWSRKEVGPVEFALQATKTTLEAIYAKTRCSDMELYLSGKNNFRDKVAVTRPYKAGRETQGKPTHWRAVRDYLISQHGAKIVDGYEADDAIGIASTRCGKDAFVCTTDKDLDQLPGLHYNWVRDEVYDVSRRDADFNLYSQILSGDATDNIPGLEGIGLAKARKILAESGSSRELFERTWRNYQERVNATTRETWNYFTEQANLIYIWRKENDKYEPPYVPT